MSGQILQKIILKLPASVSAVEVALVGEALGDLSSAHSALREDHNHQTDWVLEWLVDVLPERSDIDARFDIVDVAHRLEIEAFDWQVEIVPDANWLEECYRQFPPFSVGPFFIYGSHYEVPEGQERIPAGQMGLQIDAATAFGSGEHGTTKGCLQAMLDLKGKGQCPWNILDMGTGSGILAVAAWALWETPVLAVDNDVESVRVAGVHRDLNDVPSGAAAMRCVHGDGFSCEEVLAKKPFDLVIANILASSLMEMVETLVDVMDDNGYVILSGILNEQAQDVIKAYEAAGLALKKTYEIGEWTSLVMGK